MEYAVVAAAFAVVVAALAALWRQLSAGTMVQHALAAASHHVQLTAAGFLADVLLY